MTWLAVPWAEVAVVVPLVGAAVVALLRRRTLTAARVCLGFSLATLGCSAMPWAAILADPDLARRDPISGWWGGPVFAVDRFSAPLLPLVALLHTLTVLATARSRLVRFSPAWLLVGEALRLATFAADGWPLVGLLVAGTAPPYLELVRRGKPTRVYVLHMAVFAGLLVLGWAGRNTLGWLASAALLLAVLVRCGTVPGHLWVADLFEHASFATALLYVAPITGVYAAVRLVLPLAPDWVLTTIGVASLVTALYAAGLAVVQREARRFFAYLFLSHSSLVLVGLELHTTTSLAGALCLWCSVVPSLGGLGLTVRALESRFDRLALVDFQGLYEHSPALAVCFAVTGLASVGFPGTLGFVAADLLVEGAIEANLFVGLVVVLASAVNGIAIVRAYLLLFTGARHRSAVPLGITLRERCAVMTLAALILGGGLYPQPGVADRYEAAEGVLADRPDLAPAADE